MENRDGSELFGTGYAGGPYSLACAAGLDERAWMKRGSHASPTRERGNPSCGPNKTAAILKSTNETCRSPCRTGMAGHPFHRHIETHIIDVD